MLRTLIIIFLIMLSSKSFATDICIFTNQEKEFFDFTEKFPFSDRSFSAESVADSKKRLNKHNAGIEADYYIHENELNIIKGGELQAVMYNAKNEYESYAAPKTEKWDRKEHDLKHRYLSARKAYCDFQRTHYSIDW